MGDEGIGSAMPDLVCLVDEGVGLRCLVGYCVDGAFEDVSLPT